jgi:hypothetical protein
LLNEKYVSGELDEWRATTRKKIKACIELRVAIVIGHKNEETNCASSITVD